MMAATNKSNENSPKELSPKGTPPSASRSFQTAEALYRDINPHQLSKEQYGTVWYKFN